MEIHVNIDSKVDEVLQELEPAIERALEQVGLVAEGYAKDICPVDTGRLKNSISHQVDMSDSAVVIGTNVEYGVDIEMGHSKKAPNGFLGPAVQDYMDEYQEIIRSELSAD